MPRKFRITKFSLPGVLSLVAALLMAIGCSESPTASNSGSSSSLDMWNPAPGTEIVPGQEVPLLREGYWEELYGPSINPIRRVIISNVNIDEDGGTVTLGYHSYVIPPNAIEDAGAFTLAYASIGAVGVDCGPSPYEFREPVLLTLSYRGTQYDRAGADPTGLHIYYVTPDGEFEQLDSSVDTEARCVRTYVDHFSRYIVG